MAFHVEDVEASATEAAAEATEAAAAEAQAMLLRQ